MAETRRNQIDALATAAKTDPEIMPALWEHVEQFIKYQARRRFALVGNFGGCEIEDLIQSGYIALSKAVQDYEPEKGSFLSILSYNLKTAFSEAAGIRTSKRDALLYAYSLNAPIDEEDPDSIERGDLIPDPAAESAFRNVEDRLFAEDLHTALQNALDALPDEKREIIKARFYDNLTLEEIGQKMGCTGSAVRSQEGQALNQLRQQAKKTGLVRFVEENTLYYQHYSIEYMKQTQTSPVEAVVFQRERLRRKWKAEQESIMVMQ